MKKLLSILLAITLVFSTLAFSASAASTTIDFATSVTETVGVGHDSKITVTVSITNVPSGVDIYLWDPLVITFPNDVLEFTGAYLSDYMDDIRADNPNNDPSMLETYNAGGYWAQSFVANNTDNRRISTANDLYILEFIPKQALTNADFPIEIKLDRFHGQGPSYYVGFDNYPELACGYSFDSTGSVITLGTEPKIDVETVTISGLNTVVANRSIQLTAEVLPLDATDRAVTWAIASGNEVDTVASINPATGLLRGLKAGVVTVTATADGITSAPFTVTVTAAVASDEHVQVMYTPVGGGEPVSELLPGQEYELRVALRNFDSIGNIALPITFNSDVVTITGASAGDAFDSDWEPLFGQYDGGDPYLQYQIGTIKNNNYTLVNEDEVILLAMAYTGNVPPYTNIGELKNLEKLDSDETYAIITFRVNDDAVHGADPNFEVADLSAPITLAGWTMMGNIGRWDQGEPDLVLGETVGYTFDSFPLTGWGVAGGTIPLVRTKVLQVVIVDYTTKDKADLKSIHVVDESFTIDAPVTWNDGTTTPTIADPSVTWTATEGRVDIINGVPTYTPPAGYTGEVTITATSNQDPTKSDTYTFNIIDLVIVDPDEPAIEMDVNDPALPIDSDFIGGGNPDEDVTWTVTKDGVPIDPADVLDDPTSMDPTFTPDGPGEYVLTVTSDEYDVSATVTITVTEVPEPYTLSGVAVLASKARNGNALYGYTARPDFDKGIKVVLVDTTTGLGVAVTYTNDVGEYTLVVAPEIDISIAGRYELHFSRDGDKGESGEVLRNENYLTAVLPIVADKKVPAGTDVPVNRTVGLVAGAFMGSANKEAITQSDVQTIKGFVGLASTADGYDTAADINEYGGVEGGDLNIVRGNVGKPSKLAEHPILVP